VIVLNNWEVKTDTLVFEMELDRQYDLKSVAKVSQAAYFSQPKEVLIGIF
jgi:hypothetical protein